MGVPITVAQYLVDQGVEYELVPHPHSETALASAAASGMSADRVVKAVVLKRKDRFMVALLPASLRIGFEQLRRLLGDDVDLANEEQVDTLFVDCEPGSVPAIAAAYGLDAIVDDSLDLQNDLYLESGDHANLVHVGRATFQRLMKDARHGRFTAGASV